MSLEINELDADLRKIQKSVSLKKNCLKNKLKSQKNLFSPEDSFKVEEAEKIAKVKTFDISIKNVVNQSPTKN